MKKNLNKYSVILTLLVIGAFIFKDKFIYLAPSLQVSIALLIYPFTFLIPILIFNQTKASQAKKEILLSALFTVLFYLVVSLLCTISAHPDAGVIDTTLRALFTPNSFKISHFIIHYPDLVIIPFLAIYILSHYILLSVHDAIKYYTNTYLGFGFAVLIAFIIDTIFMVPLSHIKDIIAVNYAAIDLIKYLTANFIVVLLTSLVLIFSYPFFVKDKA